MKDAEILYLEPNNEIRKLEQDLMEKNGLNVDAPVNGDDLDNFDYDVIVTEYYLRGESNGVDIAEKVDTNTVLYTTYERDFIEDDLPDNTEYLLKGKGLQPLYDKLDELLED